MKKRLLVYSLLTCSLLFSCNKDYQGLVDNGQITLSSSSLVLKVGEELTLKTNLNSNKVVYSSSNEMIAKVNEDGVVKGIKVGEVVITAAIKDNLKYKSKLTLNVVDDNYSNVTDSKKELIINSAPNVTSFEQGSYFDLTGLKVSLKETFLDGSVEIKEINDFTTNPKEGELLSTVGKYQAVISYPGANSLTFEYEVISAPNDDSLATILEKLEYSDKYTVDVSGTIGSNNVAYKEYFDSYCYYFESDSSKYGYAYQSSIGDSGTSSYHYRGVFKYSFNDNGDVVPGSYVSHTSWSRFDGVSNFNEIFNYEIAPHRKVNGLFTINDSETNKNLMSYLGLSGYEQYVSKLKFKVLSESEFEVYLTLYQGLGNITFKVSKIDDENGVLPKVTAYLDEDKGGLNTYKEVFDVKNAFSKNRYKLDLGNISVGSILTVTYHIGYAYYTPTYIYYDYDDQYLAYLNSVKEEDDPTYVDTGKFYNETEEKVYNFTVNKVNGVDTFTLGEVDDDYSSWYTFPEYCKYFIEADIFDEDNLDLFSYDKLNFDGTDKSLYLLTDTELATDFGSYIGTSYTGYGVGFTDFKYASDNESLAELGLYYFFVYSGSIYYSLYVFSDFGTAKSNVVESYLTK